MPQKSVKNSAALSARHTAYQLVGMQAFMVMIIATGWLLGGLLEAMSALLGGAACVVPSFYFARRLFATTSARDAKKIVKAFYLGEMVKLGLSAVMVVLIIMFIHVTIIPFITGFVGAQFGFWLAPMITKNDVIKSS